MDDKTFKKLMKPPACTKNPIEFLIPYDIRYETLRKIKNECIDIYGQDISFECNKRLVCFTNKCLGRELPWKSPTALPYLKQFAKTVGIKEGDDYFIQTDCNSCPIAKTCTYTCAQINDNINKQKILEPTLIYKDTTDNLISTYEDENISIEIFDNNLKIPWDALTKHKMEVVKKYLYENRDFKYVADSLGFANQAAAKYQFYSALNTLSEWAIMRKFVASNPKLTENQLTILTMVYVDNLSLTAVAKRLKISKQAVAQAINRVVKVNKIKWSKFVKKQGKKVIYTVPQILK